MEKMNFDRSNVAKESAGQLPTDKAYVCDIISAKEVNYTTDSGYKVHRIDVAIDVAEGDFKGFYKSKYDADQSEDKKWKGVVKINIPKEDGSEQDDWTIKSFNANICAIEASNAGYVWDWDENKLKGKKIGLVLRNKEWEFNGNRGFYSEPYKFISVDNAKAGNFRKPKDKLLNKPAEAESSDMYDFVKVDDNALEEFPF